MTALVTLRSFAVTATAAFLAACAVGPDYRAPETPAVGLYTEKPQPEQTEAAPVRGGEAQRFEAGAKISAEWWTLFGSSELDNLMRTALTSHPTLAAAQAALRQAEENLTPSTRFSIRAWTQACRRSVSGSPARRLEIRRFPPTSSISTTPRSTCPTPSTSPAERGASSRRCRRA